eukprot:m.101566 g.101566  ORF g.101566 m.101566 type:complete len:800 (+) comp10398_c0_seq1:235-2634(+)
MIVGPSGRGMQQPNARITSGTHGAVGGKGGNRGPMAGTTEAGGAGGRGGPRGAVPMSRRVRNMCSVRLVAALAFSIVLLGLIRSELRLREALANSAALEDNGGRETAAAGVGGVATAHGSNSGARAAPALNPARNREHTIVASHDHGGVGVDESVKFDDSPDGTGGGDGAVMNHGGGNVGGGGDADGDGDGGGAQAVPPPPPPSLTSHARWRILIFANNRLESLQRLCRSLQNAYINETVAVNFYLEADQPTEVYDYVSTFGWRHGPVQVMARHTKGGLINAIIEGWFPAGDEEWAFFLEDDIEVSPYFLTWAQEGRVWCENKPLCIGVSLYSPMLNELVRPKAVLTEMLRAVHAAPAYHAQVPCSWGAAYKPSTWRKFRKWAAHQPRTGRYGGDLNLGQASGWAASWKRYLLEVMLALDWTILYPFIDNKHDAYSTNHLEVGEHIKSKDDKDHSREHYELPLLEDPPPALTQAPKVSFDHLYIPIAKVLDDAQIHKIKVKNLPKTACEAYSVEGHDHLIEPGLGVTVVMTFFYTKPRFAGFIANARKYCSYATVKRVIIVWHNRDYRPPTMAICNQKLGTTAHFLQPRVPDSLSNRFIPTYRVLTRAVMTVDDDILISERDMIRMSTVLAEGGYQQVVGPFPRWYSTSYDEDGKRHLKYLYKPGQPKDHPESYPIMLTKVHISHFSLYYHYYCDPAYEEQRGMVQNMRNAEDLLYVKVVADRFVPPALFVATVDPIEDSGTVGLHSKGGHNEARALMLEKCDYNDSFWNSDVVLPPGTEVTTYKHRHYDDQHDRIIES